MNECLEAIREKKLIRAMWILDKPAIHVCEGVLENAQPGPEAVESLENEESLVDA